MSGQAAAPVARSQAANGTLPGFGGQHVVLVSISDEAIAERAYEKFVARGCAHGFDREDWMEALRELTAEGIAR